MFKSIAWFCMFLVIFAISLFGYSQYKIVQDITQKYLDVKKELRIIKTFEPVYVSVGGKCISYEEYQERISVMYQAIEDSGVKFK